MPRRGAVLGTLSLDRGGEPLHRQLYGALREAILAGRLRPGTRLPATRTLARDVGAARNTVVTAFEQLVAEGYLAVPGRRRNARRRGAARDAAARAPRARAARAARGDPRAVDSRPGDGRGAPPDGRSTAARVPARPAGRRPVSARCLGTLARAACPPPGARQPGLRACHGPPVVARGHRRLSRSGARRHV